MGHLVVLDSDEEYGEPRSQWEDAIGENDEDLENGAKGIE